MWFFFLWENKQWVSSPFHTSKHCRSPILQILFFPFGLWVMFAVYFSSPPWLCPVHKPFGWWRHKQSLASLSLSDSSSTLDGTKHQTWLSHWRNPQKITLRTGFSISLTTLKCLHLSFQAITVGLTLSTPESVTFSLLCVPASPLSQETLSRLKILWGEIHPV